MTNAMEHNQSVWEMSELEIGKGLVCLVSIDVLFRNEDYGACGTGPARLNRSRSLEVVPLAAIECSISMGSKALSSAVLMMVMAIETLFWPRLVILPKVVLRKSTAFLIPCSAQLFVGFTEGYLRKMKSSFLKFIRRFRILSDSWCDNDACWYNFLNLLSMDFLPERNSSGVNAICCLYRKIASLKSSLTEQRNISASG